MADAIASGGRGVDGLVRGIARAYPSAGISACAFLCSAQAGQITGQRLPLDGGAFPGVM